MSDVLKDLVASGSQTVGPFFHFGLTETGMLGVVAGPDAPGEHLRLRIVVTDGAGEPVPDCMLEVWQADAEGRYAEPAARDGRSARPAFVGYGRLGTDANGVCTFETVKPGRVTDADGAAHAPHVSVCLFARGLLRQIHTRIYFEGDAGLDQDPTLSVVPADRRATLVARPAPSGQGQWDFPIRLQGEHETVFFDV